MKIKLHKMGFALISVLALVSLLAILLGALMGTNRTAFSMLRVSQANDRMDRTLSSVYSYCRSRLEHDYRWGKDGFTGGAPTPWGHLRITEIRSNDGDDVKTLVGYDDENKTSFAVELCNNLKAGGEVALLKDVRQDAKKGQVVSGFCRLVIKVEGDGHLEGAEIMVRNPGLIGAVCLANDCLSIDANQLDLLTRDPIKNQARSLGETKLSGITNFMEGASHAQADTYFKHSQDISLADPVIWAGGGNLFADAPTAAYQARTPFKESHPNLGFKDQRFVDDAHSQFDIPNVMLNDLPEVRNPTSDSAVTTAKPVEKIAPGIYQIEQFGNPPVRVLTRRDPVSDLDSIGGSVQEFWWAKDHAATSVSEATVRSHLSVGPSVPGTEGPDTAYSGPNPYLSINGGSAVIDLNNRRVVLDNKVNYEVDGDFSLIGSGGVTSQSSSGSQDLRQVNPAIYFADPHAIAMQADYTVSGAANVADRGGNKGSLRSSGRINIQGDISGSSTLASKGDLTVAPGRFFDSEGNADVKFSLFSEGNVSILPPPILEDSDDRVVDPLTGKVLVDLNHDGLADDPQPTPGAWLPHEAINVSEKTLRFTGLIYAQKSVTIDLQDTKVEAGTRRNLVMEGAIVAKQGHLAINNADQIRMNYNPQFVDSLIKNVATAGQRRIEVTGWRKIKPAAFSAEIHP